MFAGSQLGKGTQFREAAQNLGRLLTRNRWSLVYGGGSVGLMGAIADAVLAEGGEVVGVIPEFLATRELLHTGLTDVIVTPDMHTRKAKMAELSDAFIALPGGLGTFEEFFEVMTWAQLGVHRKPLGLLNADGFYDPLVNLVEHSIESQFVRPEHRNLVCVGTGPEELIEKMGAYEPPPVPKWFNLEEA
ncbi:LOG family protein [Rubinisphaera margarita]|uniref:LOG family protein n=1 Tax=Rubinisphaera margarita TaxID=2909586 RepID=UPI001EE99B38|nr:TIGR00730 family Rossman fold protein [Rubinisphaera margarita]MCG6157913.1 TIGR00730 family Rossman fold protein [Rubinisphaera margarita]